MRAGDVIRAGGSIFHREQTGSCSGGDLEALLPCSYPLAYRQHAASLRLTQAHLYYL